MRMSDRSSDVTSSDLHRLQLLAHLRQQLVGLLRAVARVRQRQQRERVDLHHLAQLGQLMQGRAFQVAFEGAHIGATGHVREGFLAQATRLSNRSEEHTSELQSLMRISYAVFCLKKQNTKSYTQNHDKHSIQRTTYDLIL